MLQLNTTPTQSQADYLYEECPYVLYVPEK